MDLVGPSAIDTFLVKGKQTKQRLGSLLTIAAVLICWHHSIFFLDERVSLVSFLRNQVHEHSVRCSIRHVHYRHRTPRPTWGIVRDGRTSYRFSSTLTEIASTVSGLGFDPPCH
jgi:hypothetical protein